MTDQHAHLELCSNEFGTMALTLCRDCSIPIMRYLVEEGVAAIGDPSEERRAARRNAHLN